MNLKQPAFTPIEVYNGLSALLYRTLIIPDVLPVCFQQPYFIFTLSQLNWLPSGLAVLVDGEWWAAGSDLLFYAPRQRHFM